MLTQSIRISREMFTCFRARCTKDAGHTASKKVRLPNCLLKYTINSTEIGGGVYLCTKLLWIWNELELHINIDTAPVCPHTNVTSNVSSVLRAAIHPV